MRLYSIFGWIVWLFSAALEHNCSSAIEIRPLVPPKTAHSFPSFFSDLLTFLKYRYVFSALFSALFPTFVQHIIWDCHNQRTGTKTGWVLFGLVLVLNFPCKYVVSGCFSFRFFFPSCSFSILKTESEHRAKGRNWVERKSRSTGIVSPDTSALFLLYSIFDRIIKLKPVGWEQFVQVPLKLSQLSNWK